MEVHPAAECFRLMHDDELAELAETIKENGLRDPITLGRVNGAEMCFLVDGRNRLRACEIAGVEPRFETIEFANDDAVRAFVRDRGERRDVTKGERAMAHAMLYPEPAKLKRRSTETLHQPFSKMLLSNARAVLKHSSTLAEAVRDGTVKLDAALAEVNAKRKELQTDEAKLITLRAEASDLADLVKEERMKLAEAYAAYEKRKADAEAEERNKRATLMNLTDAAFRGVAAWAVKAFVDEVAVRMNDKDFRNSLLGALRESGVDIDSFQSGAKQLSALIFHLCKESSA